MFPDKEDVVQHNGEIIECNWDAKQEAWMYMRERRDKKMPNAWHVYEKVLQSIQDNITPSHLVEIIRKATNGNPVYAKAKPEDDKGSKPDGHIVHQ